MALDLSGRDFQIIASHKDGNAKVYNENIGYWKVSPSDTNESMVTSWDTVGRGIANLLTDTYNDTKGTLTLSANEELDEG